MKTKCLILALVLAAPLLAQLPKLPPNLENLSRKAKETAEVTLDGPLLKLTARFLSGKNDTGEARVRKALEGIDGIYVRSYQFDHEAAYTPADLDELRAQYKAPDWSRIVGVRSEHDDNADVFFKVSSNGALGGIAIVSASPRELTLVSIVGNIDPAQLMDLGGRFHIPHLEIPRQERRMEP